MLCAEVEHKIIVNGCAEVNSFYILRIYVKRCVTGIKPDCDKHAVFICAEPEKALSRIKKASPVISLDGHAGPVSAVNVYFECIVMSSAYTYIY